MTVLASVCDADFNGDTYLRILEAAKQGAPEIHVHAFSPLEVAHLVWSLLPLLLVHVESTKMIIMFVLRHLLVLCLQPGMACSLIS